LHGYLPRLEVEQNVHGSPTSSKKQPGDDVK
jgi:hypothetical protein